MPVPCPQPFLLVLNMLVSCSSRGLVLSVPAVAQTDITPTGSSWSVPPATSRGWSIHPLPAEPSSLIFPLAPHFPHRAWARCYSDAPEMSLTWCTLLEAEEKQCSCPRLGPDLGPWGGEEERCPMRRDRSVGDEHVVLTAGTKGIARSVRYLPSCRSEAPGSRKLSQGRKYL